MSNKMLKKLKIIFSMFGYILYNNTIIYMTWQWHILRVNVKYQKSVSSRSNFSFGRPALLPVYYKFFCQDQEELYNYKGFIGVSFKEIAKTIYNIHQRKNKETSYFLCNFSIYYINIIVYTFSITGVCIYLEFFPLFVNIIF
jgi:hypothetical protein